MVASSSVLPRACPGPLAALSRVVARSGPSGTPGSDPARVGLDQRRGGYGKPAVQGTEQGLNDLGRDVPRIALTNPRLLSSAEGQMCCRCQDAHEQCWRTMTLPAHACSRRLLPPVVLQGCHTVRD